MTRTPKSSETNMRDTGRDGNHPRERIRRERKPSPRRRAEASDADRIDDRGESRQRTIRMARRRATAHDRRQEDNMERVDKTRTTAACGQSPQHAAPPTAHNPTPLRRRDRYHHPTHQESRQAARVYEGAARVGEERDQQPGYHSELTQSTKSRACAGQADVGAALKQRRWVPRGRGVR